MSETKIWLNILIDESGSMTGCADQTIRDFNDFIAEQEKVQDAQVLVTLTTFAEKAKHLYIARPISEVPRLSQDNYYPDGCTALYDAIIASMNTVDQSMRREDEKTGVLFVVITDGQENSSREFVGSKGLAAIRKMIAERKEKNWSFVFMGADVDAWQGQEMGFHANIATKKINSAKMYKALANSARLYASAVNRGEKVDSVLHLNSEDYADLNE